MKKRRMPVIQIKAKYKDEWVLLADYDLDEKNERRLLGAGSRRRLWSFQGLRLKNEFLSLRGALSSESYPLGIGQSCRIREP